MVVIFSLLRLLYDAGHAPRSFKLRGGGIVSTVQIRDALRRHEALTYSTVRRLQALLRPLAPH